METMFRLAVGLGARSNPDDVVQESLIRAWRHRKTFDERRGTYRTWLLAIVANEARRARRRPRMPVWSGSSPLPLPAEERIDLEKAISKLPTRQRLAVICHYYVGLSVSETAGVMGCADGTVKSLLSDARAHVSSILEGPQDG
jgi:RNA polymerase sigma-70 factor (ECF subfamily)